MFRFLEIFFSDKVFAAQKVTEIVHSSRKLHWSIPCITTPTASYIHARVSSIRVTRQFFPVLLTEIKKTSNLAYISGNRYLKIKEHFKILNKSTFFQLSWQWMSLLTFSWFVGSVSYLPVIYLQHILSHTSQTSTLHFPFFFTFDLYLHEQMIDIR